MNKKNLLFAALMLVSGLFLTFGTFTFFKGCPASDHVMMCSVSAKIVSALGIITILNSAMLLLSKKKSFQTAIALNNAMIFIMSVLVPAFIVGGCKMNSMRCHTVSFPMIYLAASFGIIVSVIFLLVNKNKEEESK
ncbi:DUF4418 family protein [Ruminococcus flavefaciens]|uniref:DUF4418 family protein n=1 Tax=Ruminococcus flavefaciens TaxID=1265 RepID=UPI00049126BC|nr:DUF4418 family protein [Ruminococcus flavefaciens]